MTTRTHTHTQARGSIKPTRWSAAIRPRAIVTACVALRRRANILQSILVCTLPAKPKNEYFSICTRTGMRALPLGAVLADQRAFPQNIQKSPQQEPKQPETIQKSILEHHKIIPRTWRQHGINQSRGSIRK